MFAKRWSLPSLPAAVVKLLVQVHRNLESPVSVLDRKTREGWAVPGVSYYNLLTPYLFLPMFCKGLLVGVLVLFACGHIIHVRQC